MTTKVTTAEMLVAEIRELEEKRNDLDTGAEAVKNTYQRKPLFKSRLMWWWNNERELSPELSRAFHKFLLQEARRCDRRIAAIRKELKRLDV